MNLAAVVRDTMAGPPSAPPPPPPPAPPPLPEEPVAQELLSPVR